MKSAKEEEIPSIGFLGYMGFAGGATYYYEVSELLERGSLIYDENVRVNG